MKIDILKVILRDDAVKPNAISVASILNGIARHEEEVAVRWIDELVDNDSCPLEYFSDEKVAVWFKSRDQAILFIKSLEKDPWYFPNLD